jgi:hypothetical protein
MERSVSIITRRNETKKMPVREYVTNDLSLTAYMLMRGCKLITAKRLGRSYKFIINLRDNDGDQLRVDFVNSEAARFDAAVRDLKKTMFSSE